MNLLTDLLPLVVFFIFFKLHDLFVATGAALVTTILIFIYQKLRGIQISQNQVISLSALIILGGLTIFLQDERFIKWKPSIVYWGLAIICIISHYWGQKPLMQRLIGNQIQLSPIVWRKLNIAWSGFFIFMGILNVVMLNYLSTNAWVNFKIFGTMMITFVFVLLQSIYLSKLQNEQD
jgi:intracellular septation protein